MEIGESMENDGPTDNRKKILQFLNGEIDALTGILRVYAFRAGLAGGEDTVNELLNGTVVEALAHAQRYDATRPPRAWLLGIAANLVRRRQAETARLNQREPLAGDLVEAQATVLGEDELFEQLAHYAGHSTQKDIHAEFEKRDSLAGALGLLSGDERRVIRLFAEHHLDGDALAAALRVKPGAARVRLHRALSHLRRVWFFSEEKDSHD